VSSSSTVDTCTWVEDANGIALSGDYFLFSGGSGGGFAYAYVDDQTTGTLVTHTCTGTQTNICMSGTIPADQSYQSTAGLGFNMYQADVANAPANAFPTEITEIQVMYTGSASGNQVRAQINVGNAYYCANLGPAGSLYTLYPEDFNTKCWDDPPDGAMWNGVGATQFSLVVPSQFGSTTTMTDLCLAAAIFYQ
jgi:hypothetical protein